jgi:hypothetical protein
MMSITLWVYSTIGLWVAKSVLLLRKLDSAKVSKARLTEVNNTPVPKYILACFAGALCCKVDVWRE